MARPRKPSVEVMGPVLGARIPIKDIAFVNQAYLRWRKGSSTMADFIRFALLEACKKINEEADFARRLAEMEQRRP